MKPGVIEDLIDGPHVTEPTRQALRERLDWTQSSKPRCFDAQAYATLEAVCDRLIPQPAGDRRVALAARLDVRLATAKGDGWRYDSLPPDRVALTRGVEGIDQSARALFRTEFIHLPGEQQDQVLGAVQDGSAPGQVWASLPAQLLFEELLNAISEIYYSHPFAQEKIGYVGMADVQGFRALGLNRRDPIENEAYDAPL